MNKRLLTYLLILATLSFFLLLSTFGFSIIQSSPLVQFNLSYENISTLNSTTLNYTNSYRINISAATANSTWSSLTLQILNTSYLSQNYSQGDIRSICIQLPLQILLWNGTYNNAFDVSTVSQNITLIHSHNECFPGRYYTANMTVRNATQTNENVNLTVYVDIPILSTNTLNNQTGIGNFSGSMPINATTYNSYYFNATSTSSTDAEIANITGFTINMSSDGDVDVFVVDNLGTYKAKSINKTHNNEYLMFSPLPTASQMWEIRVFGNSTSAITYNANISFTTLNSTATSLNLGTTNSTANTTTNYTLRNEGNLSISNLREVKEVYSIQRFSGNNINGNTNYTFLVPESSIVSKVKVSLNWTGGSNYSLNIYNFTGLVAGNSANKYKYANVSKVDQEEYNETTNSQSTSGYWIAEVKNNTNVTDGYNVTAYLYLNSSAWITTNFTSLSLNTTGNNNYTASIQFNLTVPNTSLNGTYGGSLKYLDSNNAGISIPINFEVTTGSLFVNGSLSKDTSFPIFTLNESSGYNGTKSYYFNITNLGFYDMNLNFTNSTNLTCYSGSCPGYNATFTYNTTNTIDKNSFKMIEVNITYNSSLPANTVYSGWIYINTTNETYSNLTSHPYPGAYINLRLNLTNAVDVKILNIKSEDWSDNVVNASKPENVTIALDVYTINGTTQYTDLLITNFTGVWMQERSTSVRVPTTGNLSFYAASSPFYCSSGCGSFPSGGYHYYINATIPPNTTGGIYNVYVNATNIGPYNSSGIGMNSSAPVVVNNSGLYMSSMNGTSISMANDTSTVLAVNVTNYGPIAPSARGITAAIALGETCEGYTVSSATYVNCPSTSFNPAGYNSSCIAYWTITSLNSNYSACTAYITGTPSNMWFNPNGVNVSITVTQSSGSTSTTGSTSTALTTANLAFTSAPTLVVVQQNSTNTTTVQVKNTGTKIQSVSFNISDLASSWWSVNTTSPKILDLSKFIGYLVTFTIGNAEVKDYNVAFKAYSSEKSVTSNFTLRVTPAPAKQIEINNTFYEYLANFTKLGEEMNKTKSAGINITNSTEKYNLVKAKIDTAQSYVSNGDYFNLNNILPEIKSLLDDAWTTLNKDRTTGKSTKGGFVFGNYLTYVIIGGAIAGGLILAYLFWPTKTPPTGGYKAEKKEKVELVPSEPTKKGKSFDKIKDGLSNLKRKFSFSKKPKAEYKGS